MKICSKCNLEKPIHEYHSRGGKRKDEYTAHCKKCHAALTLEKFRGFKDKCLEYKGTKCCKCNYSKCKAALEFHHVNPNEKDFQISKRHTMKWDVVKKELDKCILVCSNCHREIHEELKGV